MKSIQPISYDEVKQFENRIDGNVKIGGYDMDILAPVAEGACYKVILDSNDINRSFLLFEPTFNTFTKPSDFCLAHISEQVRSEVRVKRWIDLDLDLSQSPEWAPILVAKSLEDGLVTIDGNHRMSAHVTQHRSLEGVLCYLFVHPGIAAWNMTPPNAR